MISKQCMQSYLAITYDNLDHWPDRNAQPYAVLRQYCQCWTDMIATIWRPVRIVSPAGFIGFR
jgi:hypothetical protein